MKKTNHLCNCEECKQFLTKAFAEALFRYEKSKEFQRMRERIKEAYRYADHVSTF